MADIDIGQISEALNDKTDRDFNNMNPSALSKETVVGWGIPDYTAGVDLAWGTVYTAQTDIFVVASAGLAENGIAYFYVDGVKINHIVYNGGGGGSKRYVLAQMFIPKGHTFQATGQSKEVYAYYPLKGAN